jgi:hypothetical protein
MSEVSNTIVRRTYYPDIQIIEGGHVPTQWEANRRRTRRNELRIVQPVFRLDN